jgi:molybdopterin-guanine dinucleotide biosynthesis protein A
MEISEPVVGVILSGGRSSRMGGGDKCLLQLAGQLMLTRIVDRLMPQVSEVIINANEDPLRFADFGLPVVADSIIGLAGPLAGVHAGLEWVKANAPSVRYIATVPSDTPFFPSDLVRSFVSEAGAYPAFLVAASSEGVHPVVGLWPVAMVPQIEDALRVGMLKVGAFTKEHSATEVFFAPVRIGARLVDPFYNINRPEDLTYAEALLREDP